MSSLTSSVMPKDGYYYNSSDTTMLIGIPYIVVVGKTMDTTICLCLFNLFWLISIILIPNVLLQIQVWA